MISQLPLACYRYCTFASRKSLRAEFDARQDWPAAVLFYHLVTDSVTTPWSISTSMFTQQIDWLKERTHVVDLATILAGNRSSSRSEFQTAITFDDGYADTVEYAIPLLIERGLPVTFFVSTHYVESGEQFPHDAALGVSNTPASVTQIQEIAKAGIEIGCHTQSHLDLGQAWPRERLIQEIVDARHRLQDWTGQSIDFFAFPYGQKSNMSQAAVDIVLEAGFKGYTSAYGAWNWTNSSDQQIRRIHGDARMDRFLNWLELDPRKTNRDWGNF
jgi:peptidoglycan/xylan/chitin deacetylase (PgdA/CDA1 family)